MSRSNDRAADIGRVARTTESVLRPCIARLDALRPDDAELTKEIESITVVLRRTARMLASLDCERRTSGDPIELGPALSAAAVAEGLSPLDLPATPLYAHVDASELIASLRCYFRARRRAGASSFSVDVSGPSASQFGGEDGGPATVRVSITDDGPQIGDAEIRRLLVPDLASGPSGMAFAMTQALALRVGGEFRIAPGPFGGVEMSVALPEADTPADAPASEPLRSAPITTLVVDDNASIRGLISQTLESAGIRTLEAGRAEQAIQVATDHPGPIDVLITDVVMPDMRGPELASWLLQMHPDMRILYVTGYGVPMGLGDSTNTHVLTKPIDPDDVLTYLRGVIRG